MVLRAGCSSRAAIRIERCPRKREDLAGAIGMRELHGKTLPGCLLEFRRRERVRTACLLVVREELAFLLFLRLHAFLYC